MGRVPLRPGLAPHRHGVRKLVAFVAAMIAECCRSVVTKRCSSETLRNLEPEITRNSPNEYFDEPCVRSNLNELKATIDRLECEDRAVFIASTFARDEVNGGRSRGYASVRDRD
jgi:hypothetical protein